MGARNYWVITVRPDGRPHAAPVWGLWWRGTAWFSTGVDSVKAANLRHDQRLTVHLESGDDVCLLEGTAAITPLGSDEGSLLDAYERKYEFRPAAGTDFFRVSPVTALTWNEQVFPHGKVRWRW